MTTTAGIREILDNLYLSEKQLTPAQLEFISGCKTQFHRDKELSAKQKL